MPEPFILFVQTLDVIISFIGIVVIMIGVAYGLYDLFVMINCSIHRQKVKVDIFLDHMMKSMIIGLDFFLAGEIILTAVVPSTGQLLTLGGIVLIRIVLEYFLMHIRKTHLKSR